MLPILYEDSSFDLKLDISDWDVANLSGVNLIVTDTGGTELLASTATTLYTQDTINGAIDAGDNTAIITSGNTLVEGDWIRLAGGKKEDIEVLYYTASTNTVTFVTDLQYDHADAGTVDRLHCAYSIDVSDTDDFTAGKILTIELIPAGSNDFPKTIEAEIVKRDYATDDIYDELTSIYAVEMDGFDQERIQSIIIAAKRRLLRTLKTRGLDANRVVNSDILTSPMIELSHYLMIVGGGDDWKEEKVEAWDNYQRALNELLSDVVWEDSDQDKIKDKGESDRHGAWMGERAL